MNVPYLHYQLALMRAQEVQANADTAWRLPPRRREGAGSRAGTRRHSRAHSQPIKSGV